MDTQFTEIGARYTDSPEKRIVLQREINGLEWFAIGAVKSVPFMQGEALKSIIREFNIRATAVAWNGILGNFALLGVETKFQQAYFLDCGTNVLPIRIDTK